MPEVKLSLIVDDNGTVRSVKTLGDELAKVGEKAEEGSNRATKAFEALKTGATVVAAAAAAAIAASAAVIKQQIDQIDDIAKQARDLNLLGREFVNLTGAADLAGIGVDKVASGLQRMNKFVVEATREGSRQGGIFKALGLDPAAGRASIDVLGDLADVFQALPPGAERSTLAMEIFGRQAGPRMASFLEQGRAGLVAAMADVERIGGAFDDNASPAAEEFNDNISRMRMFVNGLAREVAAELLPQLEEWSGAAVDLLRENRELIASDLVGFVLSLASAASTANDALNRMVDLLAALRVNNTFDGASISQQVGRRLADRGIDPDDLQAMVDATKTGRFVGPQVPDGVLSRRNTPMGASGVSSSDELAARLRAEFAAASAAADKATASTREAGKAAEAVGDAWGRVNDVTVMAPPYIDAVTQEIEVAKGAVVDLGELMSESLISAVDNLIASGKFNLGDVLESTGKAAMSRMVGAMLKEKLSFDQQFSANFLEFLPGIAGRGADLISAQFGAGMQDIARQSANVGQVVGGAMRTGAGTAYTTPYGVSSITGGVGGSVIVVDEFGRQFSAPAGQAGAAVEAAAGMGSAAVAQQAQVGPTFGQRVGFGFAAGSIAAASGGLVGLSSQETMGLTAGATIGGVAGATIGGVAGPIGAVVGGLIGAVVGPIMDAFKGRPDRPTNAGDRFIGDIISQSGVAVPYFDLPGLAKSGGNNWFATQFRDQVAGGAELDGDVRLIDMPAAVGALRLLYAEGARANPNKAGEFLLGGESAAAGLLALGSGGGRDLRRDVLGILKTAGFDSALDFAGGINRLIKENPVIRRPLGFGPGQFIEGEATVTLPDGTMVSQLQADLYSGLGVFAEDLPAAINSTNLLRIAFDNLKGDLGLIDLEAFGRALGIATNTANAVTGGVEGGARAGIGAILTGSPSSRVDFSRAIVGATVSGITEITMGMLTAEGSPFANFMRDLGETLIFGDNSGAGLPEILAQIPSLFDEMTDSLGPLPEIIRRVIEESESAAALDPTRYRAARADVRGTIRDLRFGAMSAAEKEAMLGAELGRDRAGLDALLADGAIDADEQAEFDRRLARLVDNSTALFGLGSNYAQGSVRQRELQQAALNDLDFADKALEVAVSSMVVQNVTTSVMTVDQLIISTQAAGALVAAGAQTPEGGNAVQGAVTGA